MGVDARHGGLSRRGLRRRPSPERCLRDAAATRGAGRVLGKFLDDGMAPLGCGPKCVRRTSHRCLIALSSHSLTDVSIVCDDIVNKWAWRR